MYLILVVTEIVMTHYQTKMLIVKRVQKNIIANKLEKLGSNFKIK